MEAFHMAAKKDPPKHVETTPAATSAPVDESLAAAVHSQEEDTSPGRPVAVPTFDEVVAAGYQPRAAVAIVAEEQAKKDGLLPDEIAARRAEAQAAFDRDGTTGSAKAKDKHVDPAAAARAARDALKAKVLAEPDGEPVAAPVATYARPDDHHDLDFVDLSGRECRAWVKMLPGFETDATPDPAAKAAKFGRVLLLVSQMIPGEAWMPGDLIGLPAAQAKDLVDRRACSLVHPGAIQTRGPGPQL